MKLLLSRELRDAAGASNRQTETAGPARTEPVRLPQLPRRNVGAANLATTPVSLYERASPCTASRFERGQVIAAEAAVY
jgi:hypothetical protein